MNLFDLAGRKGIVTGGSIGLGRALVEGLHEAGAEIVIIDIMDEVFHAAEEVGQSGPKVHAVKGDLANRQSLKQAFNQAMEILDGRLDILVNNAGIVIRHQVEEYPLEDWDKVLEVNLNAVFELCQLGGKVMLKQGHGKIINMASMLSYSGGILVCAYAASKGAVAILTKSLANEWASKGINVNALAPGYMDTRINAALKSDPNRTAQILTRIPAGRWGDPEDLKGPVVFLASDASCYLHGAIIPVDGGFLSR
jgi:2-dehydro-3-deoxy-D-gluconate 5-dehydrogenase